MLFDRDAEFIAKEIGYDLDRVDGCGGITVFGVSPKPDLNLLRVLVDSLHLLHLQAAFWYIPLVDATHG
jgi:hypothetical protein